MSSERASQGSQAAVSVRSLGKRFRIGARRSNGGTLREQLTNAIADRLRWGRAPALTKAEDNSIWALRDVSFDVMPGEVVGIIGRNGAGKSTLLKILSRIIEPTVGRVEVRGQVAGLLEVGTGFHLELTGRENVYLNGAILGMNRREVSRKFDEIVAFAEVEKFIDTPVKRYSSGMHMRLAFAVAAHLEPDILIIDEVLAVGDGAFQQKCLGKIGDVANHGRTVLFVSHNMLAIRSLCSRALLLESGCVTSVGDANGVVDQYLRCDGHAMTSQDQAWPDVSSAPGNDGIRLAGLRVRTSRGQAGVLTIDDELRFEIDYWNLAAGAKLVVNAMIYTADGVVAFESMTGKDQYWNDRPCPTGLFRSSFRIPAGVLNDRTYRLRMVFLDEHAKTIMNFPEALYFAVNDPSKRDIPFFGEWQGVVRPRLKWDVQFVGDGQASPDQAADRAS